MVASPDRNESWCKLLSRVTGQVQRDWGDCSEETNEGQLAPTSLHRIDPMRVEWHEEGQRVKVVRRLPSNDFVFPTRSRVAVGCEDAMGCGRAKIGEVR
jgi:hypothetical protein